MRRKLLIVGGLAGALTLVAAAPAGAQDEITVETVAANIDNVWVLMSAVLVIFMQAGFAMLESGFTRTKNVANIMMKNLMDFMVGAIAFFSVGYAIAFGVGNDWFGHEGWFLGGLDPLVGTLSLPTFFVFQLAFAATAATIVSGAMSERTKFKSYAVASLVITALIYPVGVHWLWGGGWLAQLDTPFIDFAGSTIVHAVGGSLALAGALIVGPRLGKYGPDGKPRRILGHSVPFAVLGTFILLVGWYGFNAGSNLGADGFSIGHIAMTTTLAAAAGAILAGLVSWAHTGAPDVGMAANGTLAGLVGITAGCFNVSNVGAVIIGAVAGVLVYLSVLAIDRMGIDDPVGAISVHGTCGIWGTLAVGLLATEGGLLYGDGADQLVSQAIGTFSISAWALATGCILFVALKHTIGLRVTEDEEISGLDMPEHGAPAYVFEQTVLVDTNGDAVAFEKESVLTP